MVGRALALPAGEKIQILAPVGLQKKESFEALASRLNREGFVRIRLNGAYYELDGEIPFEKHKKNELYLVVDRIVVDRRGL